MSTTLRIAVGRGGHKSCSRLAPEIHCGPAIESACLRDVMVTVGEGAWDGQRL